MQLLFAVLLVAAVVIAQAFYTFCEGYYNQVTTWESDVQDLWQSNEEVQEAVTPHQEPGTKTHQACERDQRDLSPLQRRVYMCS